MSRRNSLRWLRAAVFVCCLAFIIGHLHSKSLADYRLVAEAVWQQRLLLVFVLMLLPLNWAFEAMKWKILVRRLEPISLATAYKGVLTGIVFSFISPQMLGDYAGRFLQLETDSRLKSAGALLVGNFAQLWVSILFGVYGYGLYQINYGHNSSTFNFAIILTISIINLLVLVFYLKVSLLYRLVARLNILRKLLPYLEIMSQYKAKELWLVLTFALLRYGVFTLQFLVGMKILQIDLPLTVLLNGIVLIFLAKSVIPTLNAFGDLGLREFSALLFFQMFAVAPERIVAASLLIWLVNILIPAFVGLFFILRIRLLKLSGS